MIGQPPCITVEERGPIDVRVSMNPYATVLSLLIDTLAGARGGLPGSWRRAVAARIPRSSIAAVRVLAQPAPLAMADCAAPSQTTGDVTVEEHLDVLVSERGPLTFTCPHCAPDGMAPPVPWLEAARDPVGWRRGLADAVAAVWRDFVPVWERMRPIMDKEVGRVGTLSVRGSTPSLLMHPNVGVSFTPAHRSTVASCHPIGNGRLVMVPMISGRTSLMTNFGVGQAWVGYRLPGVRRFTADPERPGARRRSGLVELLGRRRADVLRVASRPIAMRELGAAIGCAPNTATHHCDQLEAAGLIERIRSGQNRFIVCTERGRALTELF